MMAGETVERLDRIIDPALIEHVRMHHGHIDVRLQPLEPAQYQGAVCPGAGQRDIQVIPPALRSEATALLDPVTIPSVFTHESAPGGAGVIPLFMPYTLDQASHSAPPACLFDV